MRKMKKINGFLVVRFNDREKRGYPQLGNFGVIDAELYTGSIDIDLDAMEYTDADLIEIAVEQARGLDAEQDYSEEPPVYTVIAETAEEVKEEEVKPRGLIRAREKRLAAEIKSRNFPYIDPRTAAHELVGYKAALYDLGLSERMTPTARAQRPPTTGRSGSPRQTATYGSPVSMAGSSTVSRSPRKPPRSPRTGPRRSRGSNYPIAAQKAREGRQKPLLPGP